MMERYQEALLLILSTKNITKNAHANCGMWGRTERSERATIRDEVDLNQLGIKLMAVVEETVQPAQVSLWLRPSNWQKEGQLHHLEAHSSESITYSKH